MTLSIVTVCYNAASTIADAVQSVLDQALPKGWKLEYIVVDGASTDGTLEVLSALDAKALQIISEPDRGLLGERQSRLQPAPHRLQERLPSGSTTHNKPHTL